MFGTTVWFGTTRRSCEGRNLYAPGLALSRSRIQLRKKGPYSSITAPKPATKQVEPSQNGAEIKNRINEHSRPLVDERKTLRAPSLIPKTAHSGAKTGKSDPLVSLPVQIQKRQQKNGPKSPTKTPSPDTKRGKTDPNGAKIKKSTISPPLPQGEGPAVRALRAPSSTFVDEQAPSRWERG